MQTVSNSEVKQLGSCEDLSKEYGRLRSVSRHIGKYSEEEREKSFSSFCRAFKDGYISYLKLALVVFLLFPEEGEIRLHKAISLTRRREEFGIFVASNKPEWVSKLKSLFL